MRLSIGPRRSADERLLWSRDIRFVHHLAAEVPGARVLELDSGAVLIAAAADLTESLADEVADDWLDAVFGIATVDAGLPEADRYLTALSEAVQVSGLADRIGMAQTTQVVQTKTLDYFFSLRTLHGVAFQPIVELATGELHEYECLFRPSMPMLPQSIGVDRPGGHRHRPLDRARRVHRRRHPRARGTRSRPTGAPPASRRSRLAINLTPASLLDPRFEAAALAAMVRDAGLDPRQLTIECTEQQAVADVVRLQKAVRALRRVGFGFAVDDAGAGYASFALIAALRPTVIKIDRDIVGRHRPRRRQAGPRRGVRVVRSTDRRPPAGRGHREARRPRHDHRPRRRPRPGLPAGSAIGGARPRRGRWRRSASMRPVAPPAPARSAQAVVPARPALAATD